MMRSNARYDNDAASVERERDWHTSFGVSTVRQFVGGGEAQTMQQLSGGQKTMVALCLIFQPILYLQKLLQLH